MNKTSKLYLYTFLGVGLIVFVLGFIGINISMDYIQKHYIKLQIDVNKRQAEQMSYFVKKQINNGIPLDSIVNNFQESIVGTEHDKGFLCIYDTEQMQLISHPNENVVGMTFTEDFIFKDINNKSDKYIGDIYNTGEPAGGIFIQGDMRTDIIYTIPIEGTNWYLNAHENIDAISSELKHVRLRYIIGSFLLGLVIAMAASVTARKISRIYEKQIEQKNEQITKQRDQIAIKKEEITDSINYAERIQTAVLPDVNLLKQFISHQFIIYKPKDIVSGDFYWFTSTDQYFIIAAADCTGHGVPGAFMSMLGVTLLNEIVVNKNITDASGILNELRLGIKKSLRQEGQFNEQKDGMDIALCVINHDKKSLQYAGANNPLYLIRKDESSKEYQFFEFKADRMPIGIFPKDHISFKQQDIKLNMRDRIYIFSDGFVSQFGGVKGSKFKSNNLKNLLLSVQDQNMEKQKLIIEQSLEEWKGSYDQVDDILLIGMEF
jgi:serine phosphatase RsbU (regulator of sigma subunit)